MKFKHLLKTTVLTLLLIIAGKVGWGQKTLTWQSTSSTDWTVAANWYDEGASAISSTAPVAADIVVIDNSRGATAQPTLSGTVSQTIKKLTVGNGFTLTLSSAQVFTATTGLLMVGDATLATNDIIIQNGGTINNIYTGTTGNGLYIVSANDVMRIDAGGKYIHDSGRSFGTPWATSKLDLDINSTIEFGQNCGTAASLSGRTYGNLTLSATAAKTYTGSGAGALVINGTLTLSSANVTFSPNMTAGQFTTIKNIVITGGTYSPSAIAWTITITGDITNNGTLTLPSSNLSIVFNGTSTISGSGSVSFANGFTLNATKTITLGRDIDVNTAAKSGVINGIFDCGTFQVTGVGNLTTTSGSTLKTANVTGIDGSIAVSGTKSFDANTNYEFNGATAQVTGSLLPSTINNLTINNSNGVTLSGSTTVNGTLTMNSGQLALGGNTLGYGASATLAYTGSSAQTTSGEIIATVPNITINNSNGVALASTTNISGALTFTNGKLDIGANNLTTGSISGSDATKYVVLSGVGSLKMNTATGTVTYPIGTSTTYTPFVTTGNTAGDVLGVNVKNSITNATLDNEKCVKLEWQGNEGTPGGNTGTVTFQWNASNEGSSIDHLKPFMFAVWDGSKYQANIVTVDGSGPYTVTVDAPAAYPSYPVIIGNTAAFYLDAPVLAANTTNNNVDNSFDITFATDATWEAAITAVKDGTTTLTVTNDYTVASGKITLIPTATNSLRLSGSRTITVIATGYADATVTQEIKSGAFNQATMSNAPAMGLGATSTVTLTAKDQFNNLVSGYIFKYDVTITNTNATNDEPYTIDGIVRTASISDVAVTATNASGVATFDITVPGTVDGDDGISVQVQLNDGTTNLGSVLSYMAPTAPTIVISPATIAEHSLEGAVVNITVQNTTFVDAILDQDNFKMNNRPTGLTISAVEYIDATHAKLTLAYDDAANDFDVDVTNINVDVWAAELTSGALLTSNDIKLVATVEVAPTVTTDASIVSNGVTTATWGGNVSATGGEAVTVKGLCWGLTTLPTTADNKTTEAAGIGAITGNMTGLLPNTLYYVRAYATNSVGTAYDVVDKSFTTYSDEPTNQVNTFAVTPNGTDLVISWVNNDGAVVPTHYLIKASTTNNITDPVDFTTVPSDQLAIGDNNGVKVCAASETSFTWTGLTVSTPYYFKIYALAKNADNIPNYNTTSAPAANATTNSAAKDITATTIGTLDAVNKKITGIPSTTTVTALKAAITVSANATFDVLVATGGASATGTSSVTNTMVIKVIAQNLTSQEYTITTVIATTIVDNLAALIALPANTPVKYTGKATITYMRTSRNQKYIQDATGAVLIDDPTTAPGFITGTYAVGDGITNIEGKIVLYYGLVELTPTVQTGSTCTGNPVITPEVKTLASLTTADQSKLVKVENFTFTNPATEGDASGNFAASKNYTISDGVARDTVCQFRTGFSEANYLTTAIPTTPRSANVLVVIFKKNNFSKVVMQIVARNLADFLLTGIDDNQNSNLSIYPNPFNNEIRFEGSQSVKRVVITSITGQVLKNVEIGQVNFVNTQDLPKGMYLVTFMNSKGEKTTQKMVKQ